MRNFLGLCLLYTLRFALSFRYRVTIKGLDKMNPTVLNKPGGVLLLPNHSTFFVDPTLVAMAIWKKYPIRPLIVEYMFYTPIINTIMRFMRALPIPSFINSSNSLKKKKAEKTVEDIIENLKKGDNFLVYPAGKTKRQAKEIIGASGTHRIIQTAPQANVVLVRTTGLWGSRFSRALTAGKAPPSIFSTIFWGIKTALKNLLFFTPRRHVTIEFVPAGENFPYTASRAEMNRYLESWYNRPDGLSPQLESEPGETLNLVSYSMWRDEFPEIQSKEPSKEIFDVKLIPMEIQDAIKKKLSDMTQMSIDQIGFDLNLAADLGLDSLDAAELVVFLDDQYEVTGVPVKELTTVGKLMALASKQILPAAEEDEEEQLCIGWKNEPERGNNQLEMAAGTILPEVFLNCCEQKKKLQMCADQMAGVLTYADAKLRVVLLAEYIRNLPGEYIGILLPSSVAAYLTILACQLAGKIPLLINWTMGPGHLESILALSKTKVILSSWAFLDRLENVDLSPIEDAIVLLEDVRRAFTLKDKLRALIRSKQSPSTLLSTFNIQGRNEETIAVLLFTSGTENQPKGVPLTHKNIISNQRAALKEVKLQSDDIILGMLPPFHSFGFTLSGLMPLLCGLRAIYSPDPTDGPKLAKLIQQWQITVLCGAPTFLKGIFKNADSNQMKSVRICFSGAEKAPEDLFNAIQALGHCRLFEGYGITECSPVITVNMSEDRTKGVGKPLFGIKLKIVHPETHLPSPEGEQGLILVRGPNVFKGYINPGVASPFVTIDNEEWYVTGDLGYFDQNGALILSGRLKRFIKIGGEMVSLSAVEDALQKKAAEKSIVVSQGPILAVCAVEEAGERAKIYVFTCFDSSTEELNRWLKESGFSNLVRIFQVEHIEEIPLMGSGKIFYRLLEQRI